MKDERRLIFLGSQKNPSFRVGFTKGDCLKSRALTVCRFKGGGGLGEKEGAFLRWGVDTPMHTMQLIMIITDHPKLF